jgi:hypothetical protein
MPVIAFSLHSPIASSVLPGLPKPDALVERMVKAKGGRYYDERGISARNLWQK